MEHTDVTLPAVAGAAAEGLKVLVLLGESVQTFTLPLAGPVVLGRGGLADISIEDSGISRKHAVIHVGEQLKLEDLGSVNGTRLRSRPLDANHPTEFHPGDLIEVGAAVVLVQPRPTSSRPRRIWKHDYFEGRVEEECARAQRTGTGFTVVRLHVEGVASAQICEEVLSGELRVEDCCSLYGPNEYELLLTETDPAVVASVTETVRLGFERAGATCSFGTARFPLDGHSPEQLIEFACAAVQGVSEASSPHPEQLVIQDDSMRRLYELILRISSSNIAVLILGETGVGKEVIAEAVHRSSTRADKPFVRINCAAVAESLFESELFGHEKGAFTGAVSSKPGLIETADGGTVFLDEIGEISMAMQSKLLRVLESREVLRVGGLKTRVIDVRFVAATNQDLEARSRAGTFRQDLYFRLNGFTLHIPPLRERVSEIVGLANRFIADACEHGGRPSLPRISPAAQALLKQYPWPGNIRELRNVIDRAVLLCGNGPITPEHLPVEKMHMSVTSRAPVASDNTPRQVARVQAPLPLPFFQSENAGSTPAVTLASEERGVTKAAVVSALEITAGNQTKAALLLGISRRTLVTRIKEYGLPRPRSN